MIATDYDPDMVSIAQQILAPFGDLARAQQADAADLPSPDNRFDLVRPPQCCTT